MVARWEDTTRTLWLDAETFSRVVHVHDEVTRIMIPGCDTEYFRASHLELTLDMLTRILGGPLPIGDWTLRIVKEPPKKRLRWTTPTLQDLCHLNCACPSCLPPSY